MNTSIEEIEKLLKELIDEYFAVNLAPEGVLISTLMGAITPAINKELLKARLTECQELLEEANAYGWGAVAQSLKKRIAQLKATLSADTGGEK